MTIKASSDTNCWYRAAEWLHKGQKSRRGV